jgi:hypothetical protein
MCGALILAKIVVTKSFVIGSKHQSRNKGAATAGAKSTAGEN